ncbi:L-threonylcarbamoyladenylate synthase [Rhodobacteraceae bacterium KMM 6894]|nr:L-threonylcarbamoyladenylate synthase [Rhodobacteraceae bacterium KMM 6894]
MTDAIKTQLLSAESAGIAAAARLLQDGELVAFPTETVYGLGGDARQGRAVAAIYAAKGRPQFNPLIVHVPDVKTAQLYAEWSDTADRLASAFWPGPLTLVLPLLPDSGLSSLVTAGLNSVAIRIPAHPVAQALLRAFGGPLAAPSANPSGRISPTQAAHVANGLTGRIAAILDGGPCTVGVESTILGLTGAPTLLRPGGLPAEAINAALMTPLQTRSDSAITAPGQLASHYAPKAAMRLNATTLYPGETLLGFGPNCPDATLNLSPAGDLTEAAANLFDHLHRLDALGAATIAVSPIPAQGLGIAILDRLTRAAAPRTA